MTAATAAPKQGRSMLDRIESLGNKVPHPVLMFLYLIIGVIVLSTILAFFNVQVTDTIAVPDGTPVTADFYEDSTQPIFVEQPPYGEDWHLEEVTIAVQPLLSVEGIRFIFTSFVPNFTGFAVVGIAFIALMGAGVAERAGLMSSLIRLLVAASPRRALAFVLIFVGVLASVATDAGYLILVPLGAAAFASVGRHPLAGLAHASRAWVPSSASTHPGTGRRPGSCHHQRSADPHQPGAPDHPLQLVLQRHLLDRPRPHRGHCHRAHRREAPGSLEGSGGRHG